MNSRFWGLALFRVGTPTKTLNPFDNTPAVGALRLFFDTPTETLNPLDNTQAENTNPFHNTPEDGSSNSVIKLRKEP